MTEDGPRTPAMDEVTKIDISDELRQTAGYLISGTIADGEVSTFMLTDAADEIDSLRSRLAAQSAAPVGEPVAWRLTWPDGQTSFTARKPKEGVFDMDLEVVPLYAAPQSPSGSPVGWGDDYPEDQS